jgi:hypothetical protein
MSNKPGRGGKVFEWDLFVRPALIILMRGGARPPIRLIFLAAANEGSGRKSRRLTIMGSSSRREGSSRGADWGACLEDV